MPTPPDLHDINQIAHRAVRAMKRAWTESHAIIERRFEDAGKPPRWEATSLHSQKLLERQADEWIIQRKQLGQYRMISIWHQATIGAAKQISFDPAFNPTRSLEFFRDGDAATRPTGGIWRPINWQPSKTGYASAPGRWDDLAEAIAFLEQKAPAGEYRIITIRRMLHAAYQKGQLKIIKKHASGKDLY